MTEKRFALLIANSASFAGEPGQEIPSETISGSVDLIRRGLTALGDLSFGWPEENGLVGRPKTLLRQSWTSFLDTISSCADFIDDDTLFLLYYFGHGVVHEKELHVAFGDSRTGKADKRPLSSILDELSRVGVRKLIVIADHCHAGFAERAFAVQDGSLSYFILAASQTGYTYFDHEGGLWTLALSEILEKWNWRKAYDPSLGYGTFEMWFRSAQQLAKERNKLSPYSRDGGLAKAMLFRIDRRIRQEVLGSRTDRTIYNRLYLLLQLLSQGAMSAGQLQSRLVTENWKVFLIARKREGESEDTYLSTEGVENYLHNAMNWRLVSISRNGVEKYELTYRGKEAVSNNGSKYNEMLRNSIYEYLADYNITYEFIEATMRKVIGAYDMPDVQTFLRQIQYELGVTSIDRFSLEFTFRMLSQSGDFQQNSGCVFFPANPAAELR